MAALAPTAAPAAPVPPAKATDNSSAARSTDDKKAAEPASVVATEFYPAEDGCEWYRGRNARRIVKTPGAVTPYRSEAILRDELVEVMGCMYDGVFGIPCAVLSVTLDRSICHPLVHAFQRMEACAPITISDCLRGFAKHNSISSESFLISHIYMMRLLLRNPTFICNERTIHRLAAVCLLVAHKYHDDLPYDNRTFAEFGKLRPAELNRLEVAFVGLMEYDFWVTPKDYAAFYMAFCDHIAFRKQEQTTKKI